MLWYLILISALMWSILAGSVAFNSGCDNRPAVATVEQDRYGGLIAIPSSHPKTGWFRVEKFGDKWMFVDPDNNAFFLIAVDGVATDQSKDDRGSSYWDRVLKKYGDSNAPKWGPQQIQRLRSWGFTATGTYSSLYVQPTHREPALWKGDHYNPEKLPFIAVVRPSYYGMVNDNGYIHAPVKNMMHGMNSVYYREWNPPAGVADYYDDNLYLYLAGELKHDEQWKEISTAPIPYQKYLIGINVDDGDQVYGFGPGPDFTTRPTEGRNHAHLGLIVLTMSPMQAANASKRFVYSEPVVYSKKALRDMLVAKYKTVVGLNRAWGSTYTTFDSSGTAVKNEPLTNASWETGTLSTRLKLAHPSKLSIQLFVEHGLVAGDTGQGRIFGTNVSGTVDYETGDLHVTFSPGHAPPRGSSITANYVAEGWGYGTGLMDEDGKHKAWLGSDFIRLTNSNKALKSDMDTFLDQMAAYYFSHCRARVKAQFPNVLYLGPDTLGSTWAIPPRRQILTEAGQYIDVMALGGSPQLTNDMIDFIVKYYGDKPFYNTEFRVANMDSALWRYQDTTGVPVTFSTQVERGQAYAQAISSYVAISSTLATSPYVGIVWWRYLDNWSEKDNWGLVTLSDNAYNGREAVRRIVTDRNGRSVGGEERDYGDVVSGVAEANESALNKLVMTHAVSQQ